MKEFNFSRINKSIFYIDYLFSKLVYVWVFTNKNKSKLALHELLYMLGKLTKTPLERKFNFNISTVDTHTGVFKVRNNTNDITCVSPSFERPDIEFLKKLIKERGLDTVDSVFLDVGADIGLYSVLIGNKTSNMSIYAFEPNGTTFEILEENIKLNNGAKRTSLFNFALGAKNEELYMNFDDNNPGSSSLESSKSTGTKLKVSVKRLDKSNVDLSKFNNLIIKIDVEGFEQKVLDGALEMLKNKNVFLLIEDFISIHIVEYLKANHFEFIDKRTPYNSWWLRSGN